LRQLIAAAWRFAEPEGDRRRHAARILPANHAALDPDDAV
jgi:hypothetical protein